MSDDSFYINDIIGNFAKYMCCTSSTEATVIKNYSRGKLSPILCGFPRHDFLLKKYREYRKKNDRPKCIFITFHYRTRLNGTYVMDINNLLNSYGLKKLHESGVKIFFLPHAALIDKVKMFNVPKYVEVPLNVPF